MAIIEPTPVATNQSGRARRVQWRLRFRTQTGPSVDPLTGWTGGSDPLAQVILRFPSFEAADRYCRVQHLNFEVRKPASRLAPMKTIKPDQICEQQRKD
ncbi:NADH dehydrogenase ubiquinone Fe-S protein 4 [Sphingomonas oligoaromativorans]|uniref:NADH dehydrogenase ubiquinone Fe-S protein 4 n=1 Tax=Sphingomonas oligoaromativorans TaxID=575322 RepID=UPI001421F719|nr:NADH dehydrogenase ubiquinone Fe-S protein 4 [Sphingomonas oligoaromativorans]NIJ35276.1 hypothetical protein [Sphingomonas oligoaromativorans]